MSACCESPQYRMWTSPQGEEGRDPLRTAAFRAVSAPDQDFAPFELGLLVVLVRRRAVDFFAADLFSVSLIEESAAAFFSASLSGFFGSSVLAPAALSAMSLSLGWSATVVAAPGILSSVVLRGRLVDGLVYDDP